MLDKRKGTRRFDQIVTISFDGVVADDYGRADFSESGESMDVHASVTRMSAHRTLLTFQLADVIGVEIEMRNPGRVPSHITWKGHDIHYTEPLDVDGRGRLLRFTGYYQEDVING